MLMKPMKPGTASRQRGVTLLDALVALFALGVAMLTHVAVETRLQAAADIAKQRSEAVRFAQEDMENFRAFSTLLPSNGVTNNFAFSQITTGAAAKGVLAESSVTSANASYSIARGVADSTNAKMKDLWIQVGWQDRSGTDRKVSLRSIIASIDPQLAIAMAIPPEGSPVRNVRGRDVNIPIPATDLGHGSSVFKPVSDGTTAYVFSNATGNITSVCTAPAGKYTAELNAAVLSGCTTVEAYLLSGNIRFCTDASNENLVRQCATFQASEPRIDPAPSFSIRVDLDARAPNPGSQGSASLLSMDSWPGVDSAIGTSNGYAFAPECATEYLKTVLYQKSNTGGKIPLAIPARLELSDVTAIAQHAGLATTDITGISEPSPKEYFLRYACAIYPIDLDGDASTPRAWTGRVTLWPETSAWALGRTATTYKVCRYSADYNLNGYLSDPRGPYSSGDSRDITKIDNTEHPYAYLNVSTVLSNQNYLVIRGNQHCPTDGAVEVDGRGNENYTDTTTVLHQP